jgi:hypothetical protein
MADQKISELSSATTLTNNDSLLLVQSAVSKKVSVQTFFENVPGRIMSIATPETLAASGAISLTKPVSILTASPNSLSYTLAAGVHGQEKIIVSDSIAVTKTATVTVSGGKNFTTLTFNANGQAATLKYITNAWFLMSYHGLTKA